MRRVDEREYTVPLDRTDGIASLLQECNARRDQTPDQVRVVQFTQVVRRGLAEGVFGLVESVLLVGSASRQLLMPHVE